LSERARAQRERERELHMVKIRQCRRRALGADARSVEGILAQSVR
jgi:hypothetical protein